MKAKKYKKCRTLSDIQNDPRVSEIHSEIGNEGQNSWWCYLRAGWQLGSNLTCHTSHEDTIRAICDDVNGAIPFPDDPELKTIKL